MYVAVAGARQVLWWCGDGDGDGDVMVFCCWFWDFVPNTEIFSQQREKKTFSQHKNK